MQFFNDVLKKIAQTLTMFLQQTVKCKEKKPSQPSIKSHIGQHSQFLQYFQCFLDSRPIELQELLGEAKNM